MLNRVISALEAEIKTLEQSALKNPPDVNLEFHFGRKVGEYWGLQKALNAVRKIIDEAEEAHEIRR